MTLPKEARPDGPSRNLLCLNNFPNPETGKGKWNDDRFKDGDMYLAT